ncbi:MAG TPA: DUF4129 domain-containing protein [Sedimentisphaerales bacterium]|nr:DUF4129 domain-containing protein [Sedimentisphaerales bacterium]
MPVGLRNLLLLLVTGTALATVVSARDASADRILQYERPDAQAIKDHTRQILSDPQFAPRKTFAQWLQEKLRRWDRPDVRLPRGIGTFLLWAVIAWCLLTLLAIFIHLLWTIWVLFRRPQTSGIPLEAEGSVLYERWSFEQLWQKSQDLAQRGAYRDAAGVLLLALLRRLDASRVLRFHTSKTNGEYLREYPAQSPGRSQFTQLVAAFERSIYGGLEVPRQTYETMNSLAERIVGDVVPKP